MANVSSLMSMYRAMKGKKYTILVHLEHLEKGGVEKEGRMDGGREGGREGGRNGNSYHQLAVV